MLLIKNGTVHTMGEQGIVNADILMDEGKIIKIEKNIQAEDAQVIDASGKYVFPGMVEAHCHLGIHESSIRTEGNDTNEASDPITPQMRAIDGIYVMDETVKKACAAGITSVASGPGSANVIGGTFAAWKTYGTCIDEMLIDERVAMKCAFGENPKMCYQNKEIKTRMKTAALLRELLFKTKEYMAKKDAAKECIEKQPSFDMKLEAMIPVIKKEIPLKCHAHRMDDIATVIRIAKEFDVNVTLDHCTEGHLILNVVKESGFPAIVGPSFGHKTKYELKEKSFDTPAKLHNAKVKIAITTDSPVVPQEYLGMCAALAMKHGLEEMEALKAITINPAEILGLDDRIGSLEVGKDGDAIICDSSILDLQNHIEYTIINGEIAYSSH